MRGFGHFYQSLYVVLISKAGAKYLRWTTGQISANIK